MDKKVILLTGASSGLGKSTADYLTKKGYIVLGTSRTAAHPDEIRIDANTSFPLMIKMDVTSEQSISQVISFIQKKFGRIDILINNAGWGISGPIEETSIDVTKSLFEINVFGMLRVTQQVLPLMRTQNQGLIINISSIGGVIGLPFQGLYSASKFAVEGISESLRMEVSQFGIKVVLVEPGDFKTSFTNNRKKICSSSSTYAQLLKRTTTVFEHDEQNGCDPILLAFKIEKIIRSSHPKVRYRIGSFSQKLVARIKGFISDKIVQWILMKYYKVK
ncbi:MAG: SDR family oxidoreductase [Candidatus Thermoplasmatota archaeon]|nr:SDR family oxidoreductase [Candidatus Thermoplasmatota archaeon]